VAQDIVDVYRNMGFSPRQKTATEWAGPCPFCGGRDRFVLKPFERDGRGSFFCRVCGRQDDGIKLLKEFQGASYREACRVMGQTPAKPSGHGPQREATSPAPAAPAWTPKASEPPNAKWRTQAGKLIPWAAKRLQSDQGALAWLASERGITPEIAARFHIGWLPEDLYRDRTVWGLPQGFKPNGRRRMLWLPHGLVLPVLDTSGRPARIKFRRPNPGKDEPKYLYLPSEPKNTAPLSITGTAAAWVIVESELDALLLAQEAGDLVNVLALGSASLRPDAEAHARLEAAPFVLVSLDFDDAGNKAAWEWWTAHYPPEKLRIWPVPEGKDPCEAWRAGWDLRAWIEGGLPPALLPARPNISAAPAPRPEPTGQGEDTPRHAPAEAPVTPSTFAASTSPDAPPRRLACPRKSKPDGNMVRAFKVGSSWIENHMDELLAAGWSRARLFRAGLFRYPLGSWGVAWASVWTDPKLIGVTMAEDGTITFTLQEVGRQVRQTVQPK